MSLLWKHELEFRRPYRRGRKGSEIYIREGFGMKDGKAARHWDVL